MMKFGMLDGIVTIPIRFSPITDDSNFISKFNSRLSGLGIEHLQHLTILYKRTATMIYYSLYLFSKFMKENGSNYLFVKPHMDAIFLLSAIELLNISTLWILLSFESVTGNTNLDVVICSIYLLFINGWSKLSKQRYKETIRKIGENEKHVKYSKIITIAYSILSVVIFYRVHSSWQI